jgi:hypothetical protein
MCLHVSSSSHWLSITPVSLAYSSSHRQSFSPAIPTISRSRPPALGMKGGGVSGNMGWRRSRRPWLSASLLYQTTVPDSPDPSGRQRQVRRHGALGPPGLLCGQAQGSARPRWCSYWRCGGGRRHDGNEWGGGPTPTLTPTPVLMGIDVPLPVTASALLSFSSYADVLLRRGMARAPPLT